MWYRREESQKRITFFYSAVTLAGAFGGLIATGIGHMDHLRDHRAWRWVFIVGESALFGILCEKI
jgi:MFS family permease